MCENCLYKRNCQFLAKHHNSIIDSCTAFKSEADLRAEVAREIFEEIENRAFGFGACFVEMTRTTFDEIKKKYTEDKT